MSTLTVRTVASKCLRKLGTLSMKQDILNTRDTPPPKSLRSELEFIRKFRCPPQAPTNLTITKLTEDIISIAWTDTSDNEDGFEIAWTGRKSNYIHDDGSEKIGAKQKSFTLTRLYPDYKYCFKVRAFNSGGSSAFTSEVCGTTPPAPSPSTQRFRQAAFFNCYEKKRTLHFWMRDVTANTSWEKKGSLSPQHDGGSCPASDASPLTISFSEVHQYEIVAVDPTECGGTNSPDQCRRAEWRFLGGSDGSKFSVTVT